MSSATADAPVPPARTPRKAAPAGRIGSGPVFLAGAAPTARATAHRPPAELGDPHAGGPRVPATVRRSAGEAAAPGAGR